MHVINIIMQTGFFLKIFKCIIVIFVFENEDKRNVSNYRTISLINTINKLTGKRIKYRLTQLFHKQFTIWLPGQEVYF